MLAVIASIAPSWPLPASAISIAAGARGFDKSFSRQDARRRESSDLAEAVAGGGFGAQTEDVE